MKDHLKFCKRHPLWIEIPEVDQATIQGGLSEQQVIEKLQTVPVFTVQSQGFGVTADLMTLNGSDTATTSDRTNTRFVTGGWGG